MNNEQKIKQHIEKLRKTINYHRYLYHVLDKQIISDGALDSLKQELKKLEDKYPKFITVNSPTKRVGGVVLDKFIKVKHRVKQWSLEDAFTEADLFDWEARLKKILLKNTIDYTCELKIDGLHIVLNYEKGIFILGETKGNGIIGENVTENLKTIEAIPLILEKDINISVEGEVFIKKSDFEKLNKIQKQKGLNLVFDLYVQGEYYRVPNYSQCRYKSLSGVCREIEIEIPYSQLKERPKLLKFFLF